MTKKTEKQGSGLSGELASSTQSVAFAPGFSLEALQAVDENPVFATVAIRSGRGDQGSGPYYGPEILQSWEQQINSKRPPGYLGHQDPEKVSWEYRDPVTAWVGARFEPSGDEGVLYVKGYVPPTASELRTQLQLAEAGADVVNSVSVFGTRQVDQDRVVTFDLWSLDWTPKGRAGMATQLVGVSGEQAKEEEVDRDEIIRALRVSDLPEHLSGEIRKDEREKVVEEHRPLNDAVGEMRIILELDESSDPEEIVSAVRALVSTKKDADVEARVAEAVDGQISGELVKAAVKDAVLPRVNPDSTDEEIQGEIKSALELPYIAALSDGKTLPVVSGGGKEQSARQGTRWA